MKRVFLALCLCSVVLILGACKPPKDIVIDERDEYIEKGATEINMWVADFEEWQNRLNVSQRKDFNEIKDDGIQLTQTFINQSEIDDRLRSARETHSVPDIYMVSIGNLYKEAKAGYAADIKGLFDTWDDLVVSAKDAVSYGEGIYGYPFVMEPSSLLFYRKDLLKEYGGVETVPTKWDEFITLANTIKDNIKKSGTKGLYTFDVPKGADIAWSTWGMQVASTGGLAITDDWSESRILGEGKEGFLKMGSLWSDLYTGIVPLSSGPYNEYIRDLCQDKLVMTMAGSWSISEIMSTYPELKDKIGVAPMPTFDGNQEVTTATNGGWVYVISSESKHKEEAAEVLKYLVAGKDTTKTEEYFEKAFFSKASPRKSVQEKINQKALTQTVVPSEWVKVVNNVSSHAILEPIYPWDICIAVEIYLEECAMGEDINASLAKCDTKVKEIIQREKLAGTNPRL